MARKRNVGHYLSGIPHKLPIISCNVLGTA